MRRRRGPALVVDGAPVSFMLVDPKRRIEQPAGDQRYAFIRGAAGREDPRGEGYFQRFLEHIFSSLRAGAVSVVITRKRHSLYRTFGFDLLTHHCGAFGTVVSIGRALDTAVAGRDRGLATVAESEHIQDDSLVVEDVRATMLPGNGRAQQ